MIWTRIRASQPAIGGHGANLGKAAGSYVGVTCATPFAPAGGFLASTAVAVQCGRQVAKRLGSHMKGRALAGTGPLWPGENHAGECRVEPGGQLRGGVISRVGEGGVADVCAREVGAAEASALECGAA